VLDKAAEGMHVRERENIWEVSTREEGRLREKGAKRTPTECRGLEATAQTICMNWAVGVKRKQREGLKERCENGMSVSRQLIWSQAYLQIHPVMKGWRRLFRMTASFR